MNNILVVLVLAHVLGDYYLQNEALAESKSKQFKGVFCHSLLYLLIMVVMMLPFLNVPALIIGALAGGIHFILDTIKYMVSNLVNSPSVKMKNRVNKMLKTGQIYALDQSLHILTLWLLSWVYVYRLGLPVLPVWMNSSYIKVFYTWMRLILAGLILLKPTNITFKKIFGSVKPVQNEEMNYLGEQSAGRLIGNMERLLILLLLMQNQFGAIGLVFTAKSITRYNKIVEDKQFGEYYLLGTLFSLLATIIVYSLVIL